MSVIGIERVEIDRSQAIRQVSGDTAGTVLQVPFGPIRPTVIKGGDEETFLKLFAENAIPNPDYKDYYEAMIMLKQGGLLVCRPQGDALYGGVQVKKIGTGNDPVALVTGFSDPSTYTFASANVQFVMFGADPSALNNGYSIQVKATTAGVANAFEIDLYQNGIFLQNFLVSLKKTQTDNFGNSIYIETVLNGRLDVNVIVNTAADLTVLPQFNTSPTTTSFGGGTTITTFATPSITNTAWHNFYEFNKYYAHILADLSCNATIGAYVNGIALANWYQIAYVGAPSIKASNPMAREDLATWFNTMEAYRDANGVQLALNSDHATLCANWGTIRDNYNNGLVWISPVSSFVARKLFTLASIGVSQAAVGANANRGLVDHFVELEQDVSSVIDDLMAIQVNPVTYSPAGKVVWGEWTLQIKFSNTSFVSHRYYFNYLQENIERNLFDFVWTDINAEVRGDLVRFVRTFTDPEIGVNASEIEVRCPDDPSLEQQRKLKVQVAVRPYAKANKIRFEFIHAGPGGISLSEVF